MGKLWGGEPPAARGLPMLRLALAGIAGGLGLVVATTTFVSAADDADVYGFLRDTMRLPLPQRAAPAEPRMRGWPLVAMRRSPVRHEPRREARRAEPARPRYVSLQAPVSRRIDVAGLAGTRLAVEERDVALAAADNPNAGWLASRRTMCVRLCDGYAFPVGTLASRRDLPVHQAACESACPGADTALFTLRPGEDDVMQAVSLKGRAYASLRSALAYRTAQAPACTCHRDGLAALPRLPLARDLTLRQGDVVAGRLSAYVLHGRSFVDFRSRAARMSPRRDLAKLFPATPRPNVRVRLARAGAPSLTDATMGGGTGEVRVVVPSPY